MLTRQNFVASNSLILLFHVQESVVAETFVMFYHATHNDNYIIISCLVLLSVVTVKPLNYISKHVGIGQSEGTCTAITNLDKFADLN